ncbi:hypothetical protein [Jiulongibacter sediminis]|uniref:Bulb-type lectin domain-containing protein n=1 Tax=Jiulongibacter sediminis TaxID=1605367 RepID=A0A0P7C045_9BACT|nr:hypothetical protein [Jiulongibacter sediminis]KPM47894.1 hypothetical protein AFM12_11710 [Jiulongibacter sediminis]TBX24077.1 hypothetical protein TK44_11720 [Jiulongibacter sediminis]
MLRIIITLLLVVRTLSALSQTPALQWQKNIGGSGDDFDLKISQNSLGEIYIAGTTFSNSNDVPGNNGGSDIFIAKVNSNGSLAWTKNYGGSANDSIIGLTALSSGGVAVLCKSGSTNFDFDKTGTWLIKLNSNGSQNILKSYDGNPTKTGQIIETSSGTILFLSSETSPTTGLDLRVVNLNSNNGTIIWDNTFGGSGEEVPSDILEQNGFYYVLGTSDSPSVNGIVSNGGNDLFLLKINATGSEISTKLIGGSANEEAGSLIIGQSLFGSFLIVLSTTYSNNTGAGSLNGTSDIWLYSTNMDLNPSGDLNNLFGGDSLEYAADMFFDFQNEKTVILGTTYSDSTFMNNSDPIVPNIYSTEVLFGSPINELVFGGSGSDIASSIIKTNTGDILVGGYSNSSDGNLTGNYGGKDFWLIKLGDACPDVIELNASTYNESISRTAETLIKVSGSTFDSPGGHVFLRSNSILIEPNGNGFGTLITPGTVFETEIGGCP